MDDRLREFVVLVKPVSVYTVYAKSKEQAFARVRGQLDKCPITIHDVKDSEMEVKSES